MNWTRNWNEEGISSWDILMRSDLLFIERRIGKEGKHCFYCNPLQHDFVFIVLFEDHQAADLGIDLSAHSLIEKIGFSIISPPNMIASR